MSRATVVFPVPGLPRKTQCRRAGTQPAHAGAARDRLQHIDELLHFRFHIGESDQRVEFGENIWQRPASRRAASVRHAAGFARGFSHTTASWRRRRTRSGQRRHRRETATADSQAARERRRREHTAEQASTAPSPFMRFRPGFCETGSPRLVRACPAGENKSPGRSAGAWRRAG